LSTAGAGPAPRLPPFVLLIGVTAVAPVAMHLFVPSMPGLVEGFETTPARVQLTLTGYMLALAAATLAVGPLSDRYGRRPVLLAGLAVYTLGSVACALAPGIDALIAGRALQAAGGCAGLVLGRAMVRDCAPADRAAGLLASITMAMAVVPALSPALGGILDEWLGWRAGFVVLAAYGALLLGACALRLGETNRYAGAGGGAALPRFAATSALLRSRLFLGYGLHCVCTLAAWYTLVAGAPYVMVAVMGRAPSEYGLWFILISAGWIGGNFLTSRLARRVGIRHLVVLGAAVAIGASLVLCAAVAAGPLTELRLFVPLAVIGIGHGLSQPSALAGAIGVRPEMAGRASGLLGFAQMATGAAGAQLLGVLQQDTAWPLALVTLAFGVLSLAAWGIAASSREEGG